MVRRSWYDLRAPGYICLLLKLAPLCWACFNLKSSGSCSQSIFQNHHFHHFLLEKKWIFVPQLDSDEAVWIVIRSQVESPELEQYTIMIKQGFTRHFWVWKAGKKLYKIECYTCVCIYMYIYIYTYICLHTYTYIHIHIDIIQQSATKAFFWMVARSYLSILCQSNWLSKPWPMIKWPMKYIWGFP